MASRVATVATLLLQLDQACHRCARCLALRLSSMPSGNGGMICSKSSTSIQAPEHVEEWTSRIATESLPMLLDS